MNNIKQTHLNIEYQDGYLDIIIHLIESKGILLTKGIDLLKQFEFESKVEDKLYSIYLKVLSENELSQNRIFCL